MLNSLPSLEKEMVVKALVSICIGLLFFSNSPCVHANEDVPKEAQKRYMKAKVVHVDNCDITDQFSQLCVVIVEQDGIDKPVTVTGKVVRGDSVYKECRTKLGWIQCREEWKNYLSEDFLIGGEI